MYVHDIKHYTYNHTTINLMVSIFSFSDILFLKCQIYTHHHTHGQFTKINASNVRRYKYIPHKAVRIPGEAVVFTFKK